MKTLIWLLAAAAALLIIRWMASRLAAMRNSPAGTVPAGPAAPREENVVDIEPRRFGPPSSGAGDPLEVIRAALPAMSSEDIEHLLDMGATLKPGAEALFRSELARRREEAEL